jgi:glycosyltransferase involved in cell wall biosynthesis
MARVSIILPTFKRLQMLPATLRSAIAQTYADWQMIVVDDGSDEATLAYLHSIQDARITIVSLPHCGNPGRVRNAGVALASGEYIAFLDSDDLWASTKLEKQLALLARHPESRWSFTACDRIDAAGHPIANERLANMAIPRGWIFDPLLRLETSISMPTLLVARSLVHEVGGFDEALRFGEFHDFCLKLALRSEVASVAEVQCSIRAHSEHFSANRVAAIRDWMRLYEKWSQLAPTSAQRKYCRWMRAQTSLRLAGAQLSVGSRRALFLTLASAARFSLRYPTWCWGAFKLLIRASVPVALLKRRVHAR